MKPIAAQLREAFEASGMSVQALLDKSGLGIDRSSLARKLMPDGEKGALRLKAEEIDALALALGVVVTAGDEAGAS